MEENWRQALWSHRTSNFWTCQSCFLPSNWYSECEHPFQFDKLMVITDEPAVQSARLLSLGSNCIQATSTTCSRYLCYSIDAESCSSIPKSSKWSKAGFGSSRCKQKIILSWSETKKFHPIRTCVSHHLWSLILRRPFPCILYSLRVQRFLFSLLMRHFFQISIRFESKPHTFISLLLNCSSLSHSFIKDLHPILQEWVTHVKW